MKALSVIITTVDGNSWRHGDSTFDVYNDTYVIVEGQREFRYPKQNVILLERELPA